MPISIAASKLVIVAFVWLALIWAPSLTAAQIVTLNLATLKSEPDPLRSHIMKILEYSLNEKIGKVLGSPDLAAKKQEMEKMVTEVKEEIGNIVTEWRGISFLQGVEVDLNTDIKSLVKSINELNSNLATRGTIQTVPTKRRSYGDCNCWCY